MGAVDYKRSAGSDMDVRTSRFEPLSYLLGRSFTEVPSAHPE
jgi:hypothetical protein